MQQQAAGRTPFPFRIVLGSKRCRLDWLAGQVGRFFARLGGPPPGLCATRRTLVGQKGIFPAHQPPFLPYPTLRLRVKFPGSVPTHTNIVVYPYRMLASPLGCTK